MSDNVITSSMEQENEEIVVEELEDGEISNDSDNAYTPLERPENYSNLQKQARFPQQSVVQDSDSAEQSSESDIDSDSSGKCKKKKPKIKLKPKSQAAPRPKKYDIWSTRVQEDVLAETLNSCDVTTKDRSRDVESYDYVVSARYQNMINGGGHKRTRDDRNNKNFRLHRQSNNGDEKSKKGHSRTILDLVTSVESSIEDIAKDISNKLFEEREDLILKTLSIVDKQKCLDIFNETKKIEANGGMLIMNQTRRRTPGGVFLYLVRDDESISREDKNKIFSEERKGRKDLKEKRKKKIAELKRQTAEERAKLLPELISRAGNLMKNRLLKDANDADVINPPPTPETDGHENSCDGTEHHAASIQKEVQNKRNELTSYDDDFLDIGNFNDNMDLF